MKLLKFKTEILLLLTSIVLFTISAFCYSYATGFSFALDPTHPYRVYALPFVSFGSVLMGVASFSYSKRGKNGF